VIEIYCVAVTWRNASDAIRQEVLVFETEGDALTFEKRLREKFDQPDSTDGLLAMNVFQRLVVPDTTAD
jgi:hypothetical protein